MDAKHRLTKTDTPSSYLIAAERTLNA
jgi:hypothetical protein